MPKCGFVFSRTSTLNGIRLFSGATSLAFASKTGECSPLTFYVSLSDRQKPAVVPTEARGGHEFFGALCDRGYFPESVWRRAVGDTSGGLHCWPPADS
jgi:hypothetical protein